MSFCANVVGQEAGADLVSCSCFPETDSSTEAEGTGEGAVLDTARLLLCCQGPASMGAAPRATLAALSLAGSVKRPLCLMFSQSTPQGVPHQMLLALDIIGGCVEDPAW